MPKTHTPKSTAPDGESPKESIIISYPVPDSELPSAEELGASEKEARLKLLSKVSVGLGRLATGRQFDVSGTSDGLIEQARMAVLKSRLHPDTPAYLLTENTEDGSDDDNSDGSRRATWVRVDRGDFSTTINPDSEENHGLPPAEDALDAWKAQFPQSENQPPEPPVDEGERLRAVLGAAGKLNPTKAESESSTREDVLAALRGGITKASRPAPKPQTREEVLAALRGEHSSPAAERANSDGDLSVADTESESVAPENQDEPGNPDEQDPNESSEASDRQSPNASEALKALAEADTTQLAIRNMAGAAEDLARVLNTADALRAPVLFGRIQDSTSDILAMLNRFNGAVEEVRGDLPRGETPRLGDAIDQVRYALAAMNNVAEQGFSRRISDEEYSQCALQLNNSIAELQGLMSVSVERQENKEHNQ